MSTADREALQKLIESVVDGEDVDLSGCRFDDSDVQDRLERLRLICALARPHREPDGGGRPPASWGPFHILERLNGGTSGDVYRAHDPALGRDVALKLCRSGSGIGPEDEARFLDEARRLARIRHPNVLFVHGASQHDGQVGFWADLIPGITLEEWIAARGPLDAREAARVGIDLAHALAAVHAAGLVHGDVKTANAMREPDGRIVLMDFGAGRERSRQPDPASAVSGSPLYMAPEIFDGTPPGPASDIYALGVVLFRLVTGRYPVEADSIAGLADEHARGTSLRLADLGPDLPADFIRVVEGALSRVADLRPSSADAMAKELSGTLTRPNPEASRPAWLRRYGPFVALIAAVTGLGLIAVPRYFSRGFTAEATLYRVSPGGSEPVHSGDLVRPGDELYLDFDGSRELHVYVLNEDAAGHSFVLFPLDDLDAGNPLPRGHHRLPGSSRGMLRTWEVDSAGGRERIVLVAAPKPLRDLEEAIAMIRRPEDSVGRPDVPAAIHRLRGLGRLGTGDAPAAPPPAEGGLDAVIRTLRSGPDRAPQVWVHEIQLVNPRE